jgi:transposase
VTKVELFEIIRKDYFHQQKSIRQLAKDHGVHRRTVRQAIAHAKPPERKRPGRSYSVLLPALRFIIDQWLTEDFKAPRKQRHTGQRVYERLVELYAYQGSAITVRNYVYQQRKILGLSSKAFVPQIYQAGEEAEVDWYEAQIDFPEGRRKVYFFQMRACYSGREFHMAFERQNQQSFMEAHVAAFDYFGGIFTSIRYDNLTSVVKKVLRGRKRIETERFILLRSHYLFNPIFCLPGIEGAHEKGGVEGAVGRFRRAHLVPVPQVIDIHHLNQLLMRACERDDQRTISGQQQCVALRWQQEMEQLQKMPEQPFATWEVCCPVVNRKSLVTVKGNHYSVPVTYVGQIMEAQVHAQSIVIFKKGQLIAKHSRCYLQHQTITLLDHYLPLLKHKAGALPGSLALHQAKAGQQWPLIYDQYWQQLMSQKDRNEANREMVNFLWWAKDFELTQVASVLEECLQCGCYQLDAVKLIMRQREEAPHVTQLEVSSLGQLVQYERPMSTVNHYDQLLTGGI